MVKQTKIWTMASGKRIRICDMKDTHLEHTIKFIMRNYGRLPEIYFAMIQDYERRKWEQGKRKRAFNAFKKKIIQSS